MLKTFTSWQLLLLSLALTIFGAMLSVGFLAYERPSGSTAVMRGFYLAKEKDCFSCHGPSSGETVTNDAALWGIIPPFKADSAIMAFVQSEDDIREWILYGLPRRLWKDNKKPVISRKPAPGIRRTDHHKANHSRVNQRPMPAYDGIFEPQQLDDLVAYVKSMVETEQPISGTAKKGFQVASRLGCFGCHGVNGRGGVANPSSLADLIPSWDGDDFTDRVQNEQQLKQWILNGKLERFANHPQQSLDPALSIKMPAFAKVLKPGELDAIIHYISWLRDDNKTKGIYWAKQALTDIAGVVARGDWLFHRSGCSDCHGLAGVGGVLDQDGTARPASSLNDLAQKMALVDKNDRVAVLASFERGISLENAALQDVVADFKKVQGRYKLIRDVILTGGLGEQKNNTKAESARQMPAWQQRLYADGSPSTQADIDSVIAYLLTLQEFDQDE